MTVPGLGFLLPFALCLGVAACGGGGGDGGTPSGPASPPAFADEPDGTGDTVQGGDEGNGQGDGEGDDGAPDGTADGAPGGTPDGGTTAGDGLPDAPLDGSEAGPGGASGTPPPVVDDPATLSPASDTAVYAVVLENFWNADDYPQGFPEDAHLSLVGGATHNVSVSFWEPGGIATEGVEDLAETGRIDLFLDEDVRPAIEAGLADSEIAVQRYVDPQVDGVPGRLEFEVTLARPYPRVTLLTMLGPSPDWFVGVDGAPLLVDEAWLESLALDLPLYDGGSKSNLVPVMAGPGIHPNDPIGLIAYDVATGTYLPTATPQILARVTFTRTR